MPTKTHAKRLLAVWLSLVAFGLLAQGPAHVYAYAQTEGAPPHGVLQVAKRVGGWEAPAQEEGPAKLAGACTMHATSQTDLAVYTEATVGVVEQSLALFGTPRVGEAFYLAPALYDTQNGDGWAYDPIYFRVDYSDHTRAAFTPTAVTDAGMPTLVRYTSAEGLTAVIDIDILQGEIKGVTAIGWQGQEDGLGHGITLHGVPEGAKVEYSVTGIDNWWEEEAMFAYVYPGTYRVYYRVSLPPHYAPLMGYAEVVISEHTHQWGEWVETYAPTCTNKGAKEHKCGFCNVVHIGLIDPLGHDYGDVLHEQPSCTEDGYTYQVCTRCGHVQVLETLRATGHTWGAEQLVEATCEDDGYTYQICVVMDARRVTGSISATGHAWGVWVQTKAPTHTDEGEEQRACDSCGATQARVVNRLPDISVPEKSSSSLDNSSSSGPANSSRPEESSWLDGSSSPAGPGASTSYPGSSSTGIRVTGLPATIRVGDTFTLTPSASASNGRGWEWNGAFFSVAFGSEAEAIFTVLREGVTTIGYTAVDGSQVWLEVSILAGEEPIVATSSSGSHPVAVTGDPAGYWAFLLVAAAAGAACCALVHMRRRQDET